MKPILLTALLFAPLATLHAADAPQPSPASLVMLSGPWLPENPHRLDFAALPRVPSEHAVVSEVRALGSPRDRLDHENGGVNQHNYLVHHDGRFWAMWSDGPGIEDRVGQRVKFATSRDGLAWSEPRFLAPIPPNSGPDSPHYATRTKKGKRWIARGFWKRDGDLLALASLDEAAGFFGESLELRAFRFDKDKDDWEDAGLVYDNTINNFPPLELHNGEWMMSRRTHDYGKTGVHFLVGGTKSLGDWKSFPVLGSASELKAEEPDWWILPNDHLSAVFRDNRRSGFLYRAFSTDDCRTWSKPVKTNFPDATSKVSGLRLRDGRYVLVSNPNPKKRDPLTLSISEDGIVFTKMLYLVGGRHVDYPHVIEQGDSLFIAFAGGKQSVEVLKIKLADIDATAMPEAPLLNAEFSVEAPPPPHGDWIDLGNEGERLYLATDLTVPRRGKSASLSLMTGSGKKRVSVGIDSDGTLTASLYGARTTGPELESGAALSLLVRIDAHASRPDSLFVHVGPVGTLPAEPSAKDDWTLVNEAGDSQANLAKATLEGEEEGPSFAKVRIARSHAALAATEPIDAAFSKTAPPFDLSPPHPIENPGSQLLLAGPGIPEDTHQIAFSQLPTVPSQHAVVSDTLPLGGTRVNQHNYLVHHAGRFWAMWSDGPGGSKGPNKVPGHDLMGQHVSFATSKDGLIWSPIGNLSGPPEEGYGWIARGFWLREGELLALASRFVGNGYRGLGLQLHAFSLEDAAAESPVWRHHGLVMDDAMNNFEPRMLPSGEWMMSRRDHVGDVHVAVGGVAAFDDWTSFPQAAGVDPTLSAEEPDWWVLPDGNLCALFRDNNKSGYLYRAFSADHGRTWSTPVKTNFPDAKSKFCALRLSDGRYAMVSNSNPRGRNPLTLALSDDGLVFDKLYYLVGGRHVDYPHLIEHDGVLYIAFNTLKMTCEVLKVSLKDLTP